MRTLRACWILTKIVVALSGCLLIALIILAFTQVPGRAFSWFAKDHYTLQQDPHYIVVLGGGGIPSESGLMRTYLAAEAATQFHEAKVMLSLPADEHTPAGQLNNVEKMKRELLIRGIADQRITLETASYNTHQQAQTLYQHLTRSGDHPDVILVTSGYHLKRALLTFRKAGFERIAGMPATEEAVEADFGPLVRLRYEFWTNLQTYAIMARELTALAMYKAKGWI